MKLISVQEDEQVISWCPPLFDDLARLIITGDINYKPGELIKIVYYYPQTYSGTYDHAADCLCHTIKTTAQFTKRTIHRSSGVYKIDVVDHRIREGAFVTTLGLRKQSDSIREAS